MQRQLMRLKQTRTQGVKETSRMRMNLRMVMTLRYGAATV
jgi:hypothetical protein